MYNFSKKIVINGLWYTLLHVQYSPVGFLSGIFSPNRDDF